MRLPAVLMLASVAMLIDGSSADAAQTRPRAQAPTSERGVTLAGLSESVPALFLRRVNDALKGRIEAASIRYDAPSSVVLQDARLLDPRGVVVARVESARATLSLTDLLSGDLVVSNIELDAPSLDLALNNGVLNLLEALTPRNPPDKTKQQAKAEAAVRIDAIRVTNGSFTFVDKDVVTVRATGIAALASLDLDLARDLVIVDVKLPTIAGGIVALAALDVPLLAVQAARVVVYQERIDIYDASGRAAGASVTASGSILLSTGRLNLSGFVDAPTGAWPDRMKPLPFALPALRGKIDVTGPFADPLVSTDATFSGVTAYGYQADSGRGVVAIDKNRVTIKGGSLVRAGGGTVHVEGTVTLPELALDLQLRATEIPLASALLPAKLDPTPLGSVTARAHLSGLADQSGSLRIDVDGSARRLELAGVKARGDLQIKAKVTIEAKRVVIEAASLQGEGLAAEVRGEVLTQEKRIAFDIEARVEEAPRWLPAVPEAITLKSATFVGTIAGPYQSVVVSGAATGAVGNAYGVPFDDVKARVTATAARVVIGDVSAAAAGGRVRSLADIELNLSGDQSISGVMAAKRIQLATIKAGDGTDLPIEGLADAEAVLAGPYRDPTVTVRVAAGGLVIAEQPLGNLVARFRTTQRVLSVIELVVDGPVTRARSDDVQLTIEDLGLAGHVTFDRLDLAAIDAAKTVGLQGSASGVMTVSGPARTPTLQARLQTRGLALGPRRFGDGPVDLGLAADTAAARRVVSLAAHLQGEAGIWDATAAFAIERKVINARLRFSDVDVLPFTEVLGTAISPLAGFAFGDIEAWGPLDKLSMRARLRVDELGVTPKTAGSLERGALVRPLGALLLSARMDEGELNGHVCAFPQGAGAVREATLEPAAPEADENSPCRNGERVWANVVGSLNPLDGAFDLSLDGAIAEEALHDLVPAIGTRGFRVGAKARASAQLLRLKGQPVAVTAEATLLALTVQPPDEELRAQLQKPVEIFYDDRRVRLEIPAHFKTATGEIDVTVGGVAGDEDIAVDIEGSIALALAKLLSEQIANARGTAQTALSIRGRYDEGIVIEGSLTPVAGSVVTPRVLGQPVQFLAGSIAFAPAPSTADTGSSLLRVSVNALKAKIGDGEALLRGSIDVRTAREADQSLVAGWDLALSGTGLSFKLPTGRIEGGADLLLSGDDKAPVLRGRIEVNDGSYRKKLELRNFVLAAAPGKPSEPLWQSLAPIGLADLQLDISLLLQNFRARANVASFDADVLLRGNLRVSKMLRLPAIDGAIEVEEGEIAFPKARFDVIEMQVEFPSAGDGSLNPLVHLTARAELPPGAAGGNDTEIPVDLFLDGDLDKGIDLDLSATDPVRQWSRTELLGLILFGKSVEQTVADRDISLAFNALINEVSAPFTAELEKLAQQALGLDVEIEATGWRWQLGRRLQVEGDVSLIAKETPQETTGAAPSSTTTGSGAPTAATDTLRLRLLILDHLQPIGRNLSLEARNSSLGTDLRLSLRIFEQ